MEQTVTFARGTNLFWADLQDWLARRDFPVHVRMIDGELALPDEAPPPSWRELRLGTPQGMVTLRRNSDQIVAVIWGNADAALVQARNGIVWAVAEATGGQVESATGPLSAAAFRRAADLPAPLRG
jgi:hypothetical protein